MSKLAPSILSADFSSLLSQVEKIEAGGADYIHFDVMDGAFVPNISFGAPVMKSLLGKTRLPFDVHLMIENPDARIPDFVSEQTEYIVVHQEACKHLHRTLQFIKSFGIKAGVALNPATPLSGLEYVLGDIDMALVMSVNPGFGGQKFIPSALDKVKALVQMRNAAGLDFPIEIDGGVTLDNAKLLKDSGVDIFVAGSAVFGAPDIPERVKAFKALLA